jgi:polysaccharide biosynthesis/export protein
MTKLARLLLLSAGLVSLGSSAACPASAGGRVLAPLDIVSIKILDEPDLSASARVEADGTVNFPYVGRVQAAGLTEDELAVTIATLLVERKIISRP